MEGLKAPSLQSLLESDRGSTDSLLAESLQLDIEDLDDAEYSLPAVDKPPTLESVLSELEFDSDIGSEEPNAAPTPTPSIDDNALSGKTSILRHVILQGVSAQISSAADRVNAGLATAIAVHQMIAVGTSHGHVLNFDSTQTLRWAHQDKNSQGAVTDLAFNEDCTRLLGGFARGLIIMIDTKSGDILRSLFDSITPNTGVLNIRWTGRPALALCSDSGGSVWTLSFTRKLGVRGCASRCLFSGARGEVCTIEPLILEDYDSHELKSYCIVALATLSKYFVVTIRPRLKVVKFHVLNGPAECLPLLAWQMVLIQAVDTSRTIDPVLAVARGNNLYFHQIVTNAGRVNLLFLRHIQMTCNFLALHWLGPKSMACIDTSEILHLIDVRTSKEVESIDLAGAGLVYGSAQFKGLATGGNVSPALALAGTHACYSSIVSYGTQLYVLGARNLNMISVRSWGERITYLVNNQRWIEACELAIDGYRVAGDRKRRKQQAKEKIIQLFNEYLSKNRAIDFCLGPIIKCIIEINELNLLWQDLWDRLDNPNTFLTILTEHIENDEIKKISPSVAQALIDFWANLSITKVEDIILKLDWTCLDLHQVLTITRKHKLYKAQIYLNAQALGDYAISLTELIPIINKEEDRTLGNCLLVYISSSLAGRGYPSGDIPIELIPTVKHEIIRCLTAIHSKHCSENELPYPYLRELLKFDTRETLNVLSLAFEEKEFTGELGLSHRQRIINILLEIMTSENATWSEIGCLLNFISQQISSKCLPDDHNLLEKIINYIMMEKIDGETIRQHTEREQAWLELFTANCLNNIPLQKQLQYAKNAKFYYVVELILEQLKQYENILDCYLNNSNRNYDIFEYIEKYIKIPERKIYSQILSRLDQLLKIDSERIVKIISENFHDQIDNFIINLQQKYNEQDEKEINHQLYIFLKNLLKYGVTIDMKHYETYLELLCKENPENVKQFLQNNDCYRIEIALEIVKKYELEECCIYLYEKKGDYQMAFNLLLDLLKESTENTSEMYALQLSGLCSRASQLMNEKQREDIWFPLLNLILSRSDLTSVTRNILHEASQHVNLSKLVQLVLNSGTQTGNFGDIRHLLVGMLSNSRYETILMETTSRILGYDLHCQFAKEFKQSKKGLWITIVKCIVCRELLYTKNNQNDVLIFSNCSHSAHEKCVENLLKINGYNCPRCGKFTGDKKPIVLAQPNVKIIDNNYNKPSSSSLSSSPSLPFSSPMSSLSSDINKLQLKAPPRKF